MSTAEQRAEDLRARQRPVKDRYREAPESAVITMPASGELGAESISCTVDTGRAMVQAGLQPAAAGGTGPACSGDMLLEALVACAGVTLTAVATALKFELRGGTIYAEGDLDFRGTLGLAAECGISDASRPQQKINGVNDGGTTWRSNTPAPRRDPDRADPGAPQLTVPREPEWPAAMMGPCES